MRQAPVLTVCVLLCTAGVVAKSGSRAQTTEPKDKMAVAVTAVRAINTAELGYFNSNHRYGTFQDLVATGQFSNVRRLINAVHNIPALNVNASSEADAVPGYKTQLIVAASGISYSLISTDATNQCGPAFFSDTRGIIFRAEAMGCSNSSQ